MRVIKALDRAKQVIDRLTEKLLKDFPEQEGTHAVVFGAAPDVDLDSRRYSWPPEDNTPEFVKADNEGWTRITNNKR